MYRSLVPWPKAIPCGLSSSASGADPPSPEVPGVLALPASLYTFPAVMVMPKYVPLTAGTTRTRSFPESEMIMFPDESNASPAGAYSRNPDSDDPPFEAPCCPDTLPATVYMSPAVIDRPHCVLDVPGISSIRLSAKSTM